uniref:Carbohydrate kinase FGGY C-terminal domain-containing protein n=1 Tax=Romanomermis culicivorax TaxID=13658 RepID=A0A915KLC5_ROMCU
MLSSKQALFAGLRKLIENNFWKIGPIMSKPGAPLDQGLIGSSSRDMGLMPGTAVAVGMIDAHAGCLGILFTKTGDEQIDQLEITEKLALICGTSTCHMAFTKNPIHVPGVWGPYPGVVFPDLYLLEAGQSSAGPILDEMAKKCFLMIEKLPVYHNQTSTRMIKYQKLMCQKLDEYVERHGLVTTFSLAESIHVWPDYYGNRSPYADSAMTGAVLGLKLESPDYCGGVEYALGLYLAHVQAMALMTRLIMDSIECEKRYQFSSKTSQKFKALYLCGGLQRNAYFVQAHSDVCLLPVILTESSRDEPVARGAAVLGAAASGDFGSLEEAATSLGARGRLIKPDRQMVDYYARKYEIFRKIGDLMLEIRKEKSSD